MSEFLTLCWPFMLTAAVMGLTLLTGGAKW